MSQSKPKQGVKKVKKSKSRAKTGVRSSVNKKMNFLKAVARGVSPDRSTSPKPSSLQTRDNTLTTQPDFLKQRCKNQMACLNDLKKLEKNLK